jgi:CDP-glucose 4,6-dehydratase
MTSFDALDVNCRLEYGDITDPEFIDRVIASSEAEWVFHLAAVSIVRIASASPALAFKTNIMGTVNVLDACKKHNVKRVLIASSDKAYGDQGGLPYTEEMALRPTGAYEVSKACADNIALFYGATVVRCANLYGEGDLNWSRLIPNSCKLALRGESPQIYGDAVDARREWLYVKDAVNAYIALAEKGHAGAYNVGSGCQASPMEIAIEIANAIGCKPPELSDKATEFYEIPTQELDCRKIEYTLGWCPEYSLGTGLLNTIRWYKDYLS